MNSQTATTGILPADFSSYKVHNLQTPILTMLQSTDSASTAQKHIPVWAYCQKKQTRISPTITTDSSISLVRLKFRHCT